MRSLSRLLALSAAVAAAAALAPAQPPAPPVQPPAKAAPTRPALPSGTKVLKDVAYGPHERNKLDLYIPPADRPLPLVIWVHGGGWEGGSKAGGGPAIMLLNKGYAVASINYRLSQHAVFPAQIQDCRAAVRHLRSMAKENNLDADHFGAWGASAGGHLVALLGTCGETDFPDEAGATKVSAGVQAVCDWFGPADFVHWGEHDATESGNGRPNAIARLLGGRVAEKLDLAKAASPVTHVAKASAPFLIVQGDRDNIVPPQQSEVLTAALKKAGVEAEMVVVKGAGHGGPGFLTPELFAVEEAFFDKHLKAKK
jgi:acetyl esterase/lipase